MSDEREPVSFCQGVADSGGKPPPFGQRDLAALLEPASVVDVARGIEDVVVRGAVWRAFANNRTRQEWVAALSD
ncbi:hypothetical protein HXX25_10180 [Hyphobacterium sp. CCMP332]|uniref:hypothetical protein n=1 Tax=Hyphobacterium sp. CCMP332 TaxID=2749086 RepID=UPI00164F60A3|nr:hypothetical protein [Hyphobacterium sp. CCMP332]QNL19659.1 hypothetical protein HXX25_10180 [Hyphobacterium sp. CCMP332]